MSETEGIRVDVTDHLATVTIDRPQVNALTLGAMRAIIDAFDYLNELDTARVAVLGATGAVFCAGSDVTARSQIGVQPGSTSGYNRAAREMLNSIYECRIPVIASVNGPALGGGLALVSVCDLVVAAESATFGLPEIGVGLLGGARHATRLVGPARARRMMLTGIRMSAAELHRAGVLDVVVADELLAVTTSELAEQLLTRSPVALRYAKRSFNTVELLSLRDGYRAEQDFTAELARHPHSREAMAAFRERRPPAFDGD